MFLLPHIQTTNPDKYQTSTLVCSMYLQVLKSSAKEITGIFREVGLLDALTGCLKDLAAPSFTGGRLAEATQTENYRLIMECLVNLLDGDAENCISFRKAGGGCVFEFLKYAEQRAFVFGIIKVFCSSTYLLLVLRI